MSDDVSPPDSPFHGFSANEIPKPRIIKLEDMDLETPPDSPDRRAVSPDEDPFHGFQEADIPQPIQIKTEAVDGDQQDLQVVEVLQAKPAVSADGKGSTEVVEVEDIGVQEVEDVEDDDDDEAVFYGFSTSEIPLPMIIKEEPEDITVEVPTPERKLQNKEVSSVETLKRKLTTSPTKLTSSPSSSSSKSPARKMAKMSFSPELQTSIVPLRSPRKSSTAETPKATEVESQQVTSSNTVQSPSTAASSPVRSLSPEKPKSPIKRSTPLSPEKAKPSVKSLAPVSPEKAKSPLKNLAPTSPIKSIAPALISPEKSKSPMKTPISPQKAKSPAKNLALIKSPTPTSLEKSPTKSLAPISPEKAKSPVKNFAPTLLSPAKSPMKIIPQTPVSPEKPKTPTKSPTKIAAESLTSLGTAVLLPPKSPRRNNAENIKSPKPPGSSAKEADGASSAIKAAVASSVKEAAVASSNMAAAVNPDQLEAAVPPGPSNAAVTSGKLEAAVAQGPSKAAVAPGTLEAAVAETLGADAAETAILPDTINNIPFDDNIEETPEQNIVGPKGSIIVRNETGYFDPATSQSIEIQADQPSKQPEESFEMAEGREEEAAAQFEVQEGGNVLVMENVETTTTIEIHEGEDEESILVMVDGERGGGGGQEGGEVPAPGGGQGSTPGKARKGEVEQITIIETGEDHETVRTVKREEVNTAEGLPRNIQILDEHGTAILLMDKESESDEEDMEDREFTVIVDEDASDEDEINLERLGRIPLEDKNTFEGETIEDILAQFETEQKSKAVACPNCKKCFVSTHFLNIHVNNKSTLCDLCNTQCCTATNLRNHKNLDCDLSKRKRNIDLIAQETALLGRKPIEPEKYYNMPIDSSDEENEGGPRKPLRSVNDEKYECGICGQYVKILNSHMKFIHGVDARAAGSKFKCPECGVLVNNLQKHNMYRHDPANKIMVSDAEIEVVRCKNQGCDSFFNNAEELAQHQKHEHADQARLACGMGGCEAIFDSRGALRKHRSENHPELEEFKPVDLEPDDPDRDADLTVACPVCERKFKHKNTCTVHIKVHHLGWTKRKMYECPDCMKDFDNKKNLELHREAIHLGIRTICPLCEKPVTRLDLHVRMVHTELPEWPCPDCGKRFKRKFDLNRHRVTVHLGVRNFPCDLCGKRFADMKDMTRHKNAVHYGMKIKWNSKKHKEERKRKKELMEKKMQMRRSKLGGKSGNYVEFMEAGHDGGGATLHIEEGAHLVDQSVVFDPVLQSQISNVGGEGGEPRVLIEADPDHTGSLRFVVLQEDMVDEENGIEIEEEEEETETHIILEPED